MLLYTFHFKMPWSCCHKNALCHSRLSVNQRSSTETLSKIKWNSEAGEGGWRGEDSGTGRNKEREGGFHTLPVLVNQCYCVHTYFALFSSYD